ncbi:hypothetical protein RB195_023150 [Necator americanus]
MSDKMQHGNKLHSTVHYMESQDCEDPWERQWNIQSHDVEKEFCGPEKEEKANINAQVLENFNNTIARRNACYVVRFPFGEDHEYLPDNKVLALHRLRSVLRKYQQEPHILQQYHSIFQDQIAEKILEEVDENKDTVGKMKHYLPHQPVFTPPPQKDTTKLRIVFDASAHYKNCPSLNDILHQGPTILPKLYGILLRFRTPKYVLLSDVEKAFLQVHLHENDRDFARCLWIRDITKPLTDDNLVEQYDWDEPLNEEHRRQWKLITMKISNFHKKVPRKVTVDNSAPYTLVTYSDASGIAMTACTYLTSQRESSFLMAKSKVTNSNRPTTVPKLEINAITIGARLTLNTFLSLKSSISINKVIFLTDSEIVLNWLKGSLDHPKTGPYVKNRIREIRDIVQSLERMEIGVKFGYIDTKWNPADIGTRGASNHEFVSHVWWDGYSLEKILNDEFTSTLFSLVKDPELQNDDYLLNAEANVIKTHANTDKVEEILDLTRYLEMADLSSRRVTKRRPFENIGLDYFGPITVHDDHKERTNVYGCIFTCCVTRLIHLGIVSDGTTEKFLSAFRRFVARRGKPHLVTRDNAPTFILGSQILNDSLTEPSTNEDVARNMSNQMIEWKHNTPYSPWKGGFYERLIKSVKQALFKTIGRRILTIEQLHTFLVEIEGCLNCRPLTYQEDDINDALLPLRPIDFVQRKMEVTLPFNFSEEEKADPIYRPPSEELQFETRLQTEKALRSSYKLTERFWEKWKNCYLTAL